MEARRGMANAFSENELLGNASPHEHIHSYPSKLATHGYPASLPPSSPTGLFRRVKEYTFTKDLYIKILSFSGNKMVQCDSRLYSASGNSNKYLPECAVWDNRHK